MNNTYSKTPDRQIPSQIPSQSTNPLIGIGVTLVTVVPVPHVKMLGVIAIVGGLFLHFYDEIQKRQ